MLTYAVVPLSLHDLQMILEAHCLDSVNVPSVMITVRKGSGPPDICQTIINALRANGYTGQNEVVAKVRSYFLAHCVAVVFPAPPWRCCCLFSNYGRQSPAATKRCY